MKAIKGFFKKPEKSIIDKDLKGDIHYIDSFRIKIRNINQYSIDYLTALMFSSIPEWVRKLLNLRDFIVRPFGLETERDVQQEPIDTSLHYKVGDRAVVFKVIDRSESEIVMAEDDKHLYFRASLLIERTDEEKMDNVYLTTLVQFHNIWGKYTLHL